MVGTNVTIRMGEEELQRLDDLARRMNKTRSDVVRDLINNFDEALRREVDREGRRWFALGFVSALESAILDPELVLRFIRRNIDILGFPDFLIGMVRVRNRVILISHQDKIGHQLLQQVRAKVEEDVRREETEIEREDDEEEGTEDGKSITVHVPVRTGVRPRIPRGAPVPSKYKLLINSRSSAPMPKPTAAGAVGKSAASGGGGDAKAASNTSVSENKKLVTTGMPASNNSAASQVEGSNPQASVKGGATGPSGPVEQTPVGKPAGDFTLALITNLYHKHREALLKVVEGIAGD